MPAAGVVTAVVTAGLVSVASPAGAATADVACSGQALQTAVSDAAATPADDVLRLAAACTYPVTATLQVPASGGQLTLRGAAGTVLDGQGTTRILRVEDDARAVVARLVLRKGRGPFEVNQERGGAIRSTGSLRVQDSAFVDNQGGRVGGAIDSTTGELVVVRSLFTGNAAEHGGAIYAESLLTVVSSTFTGNTAPVGAAVISFATGTVSSSTFVGNHGQALHQDSKDLRVVNTVLSQNPRNCAQTGGGRLVDLGGNLEDQKGTCPWTEPSSRTATDPVLAPLADNGGPTRTFAPGPGSPLLDRGARCTDGGPAVLDQRGRSRPASGCDIGAVESGAVAALTGSGGFGNVSMGGTTRRTLTLTSSGTDRLVVGSVTATGSGFAVADDRCSGATLPKGETCTVAVAFRPTRAGASTGALRVVDSGDAGARVVPLSGTAPGAAPAPSATPSPGPTADPTATPSGTPTTSPAPGPPPVVEPPTRIVINGDAVLVSDDRPAFPQALPLPTQVSLDLDDLVRSAWIAALLLLLLGLPVGLVNDTLGGHREELAVLLTGARARLGRLRPPERLYAGLPLRVAAPAAALVSAVVYGFLDPGFSWDRASAASVTGLVVTVVLTGLVGRQSRLLYLRRAHGVTATLRLLPGFIGLAIVCTLLSRISGLQPGLVLGSVLGVQLARGLRADEEGRAVAVSCGALALASVTAWFAWLPVATAAAGRDPSFVVLVLDVVLAATFVIGVEALAFGLVPLRFLDGQPLWRWSRAAWAGLAGLGAYGFVHVVLHPDEGVEEFVGREPYLGWLLGTYLVLAFAVWGWFRFRGGRLVLET